MQRRQALALLAGVLAAGAALADGEGCTCSPSSTLLHFGAYDVLGGAPLDSAGHFSVTCRLDRGRGRETRVRYSARLGTGTPRHLAALGHSDRLNYEVYVDAARTQPWGDGTGGTFSIEGEISVGGRSAVTDGPRYYYGRIAPGGQDVSAALYGQVLTISVTCRAAED